MAKFVSRDKLGKKARKELDSRRRVTWGFSPVTKAVGSKKVYSRKRKAQDRDDDGLSFFVLGWFIFLSAVQRPRRTPA